MRKKFLNFILIFAAVFLFSCSAYAASTSTTTTEGTSSTTDNIAALQLEISSDIGKLRESISKELIDLKLGSADIDLRLKELAVLTETSSEDMASWGYSDEQREHHLQILSELSVAYTAYTSTAYGQTQNGSASGDVNTNVNTGELELDAVASPDINYSDSLRQEITKVSRGLDLEVFYLQSKINKLKLDLADSARLRKEIQDAKDGGEALELPRTHILEFENARLNVALSYLQVRNIRISFDKNVALIQRLRRRLAAIKDNIIFPEAVLNENIDKIQKRIDALVEEMTGTRKALDSANSALVRARAAMARAENNNGGNKDNKDGAAPITPEYSSFLARQARLSYWEYMTMLLEDEIRFMREEQQVWRNRYKLFNDAATGDDIWKYRDSAQSRIAELQRQLEGMRTLENVVLRQIASMQTQMQAEGVEVRIQQNLTQAIDNQRKIIADVLNRYASLIPNAIFFQQRLYNEASDRVSALRIAEKVQSFSRETIMGFLNTELWQGEGYSVTVGKLTVAVLVFLSSFFLSSLGSNWIKRRMLKRGASTTSSNATQRIVFYILWISFALIALNIVQIPLTAFAFMGGAMAVGIGFGMQNIFNNLISGFIVIFTRPFKINDIIEVAGTTGTVHDIGSRSTTIKTWDSLDVVLPNRYFLENSVTNWTGSDLKKREILKLQVSYDADTRHVEEILLKVMKSHSKVLKDPAPFVVFKNFGDSGLDFEMYFWFDLRQASGMKVSSDMRHYIMSLFREEGINIPYPQMDIHIARVSTTDCRNATSDKAFELETTEEKSDEKEKNKEKENKKEKEGKEKENKDKENKKEKDENKSENKNNKNVEVKK